MKVTPGYVLQVLEDIERIRITLFLEDPDMLDCGWGNN